MQHCFVIANTISILTKIKQIQKQSLINVIDKIKKYKRYADWKNVQDHEISFVGEKPDYDIYPNQLQQMCLKWYGICLADDF